MDEQKELEVALMAELTGRFEHLAALTCRQHVVSQLDAKVITEIEVLAIEALKICQAASALAGTKSDDMIRRANTG